MLPLVESRGGCYAKHEWDAHRRNRFPARSNQEKAPGRLLNVALAPNASGKHMQSLDFTTLVFALLAVFVVWKLRSVLGTRTGAERPPHDPFARPISPKDPVPGAAKPDVSNVVRLPGAANDPGPVGARKADVAMERWKDYALPASPSWEALDAISARDPAFDVKQFLAGAQSAYEIIVTAFAAGDRKVLRPLLTADVFENFEAVIVQREQQARKIEMTFISISNCTVQDVNMRGSTAQIAVKFFSKLISATRDRTGQVVEGSPEKITDMVDIWTFSRDVSARDPNWKLVATDAPH